MSSLTTFFPKSYCKAEQSTLSTYLLDPPLADVLRPVLNHASVQRPLHSRRLQAKQQYFDKRQHREEYAVETGAGL